MGKPYCEELDRIPQTLQWATACVIDQSMAPPWDRSPIVTVGSGGSFTAADFAARAFQTRRHYICIASSPLEYLRYSAELGAHHTVLLSAEGKNPDIRTAAAAALRNATSTIAITCQLETPLSEVLAGRANARTVETASPWGRDGYLATNSLVATCVVLAGLNKLDIDVVAAVEEFQRARRDLRLRELVGHVTNGRKLLAIHGTAGTTAAIDLECKFAEATFGTVQRTDLRQFAHGRHLQLIQGKEQYAIIAYVNQSELDLWAAVQRHLPKEVPIFTCVLPSALADAAIQGLLFTFALLESVSDRLGVDPGQPAVPKFARQIYALETSSYVRPTYRSTENAKLVALFRKGIATTRLIAALEAYMDRLARARFRGLVLDFDGTCCETPHRLEGIRPELGKELNRLLEAGMVLAFASGRGDSLHDDLRKKVAKHLWDRVLLGCHSGSSRVRLSEPWQEGPRCTAMSAVEADLTQQGIDGKTYTLRSHSGQLTIESNDPQHLQKAFVTACRVMAFHSGWRTFRSAHSIDVLAPTASKAIVANWLARELVADANSELLRIGDRGEIFGNDSELLSSGLSLTVDGASLDEDTCWLLGNRCASASERTLAYLEAIQPAGSGKFEFNPQILASWSLEARSDVQRLLRGKL